MELRFIAGRIRPWPTLIKNCFNTHNTIVDIKQKVLFYLDYASTDSKTDSVRRIILLFNIFQILNKIEIY